MWGRACEGQCHQLGRTQLICYQASKNPRRPRKPWAAAASDELGGSPCLPAPHPKGAFCMHLACSSDYRGRCTGKSGQANTTPSDSGQRESSTVFGRAWAFLLASRKTPLQPWEWQHNELCAERVENLVAVSEEEARGGGEQEAKCLGKQTKGETRRCRGQTAGCRQAKHTNACRHCDNRAETTAPRSVCWTGSHGAAEQCWGLSMEKVPAPEELAWLS